MLACCQLEVLWPFFSDIRQVFSPREHLYSDSHFKLELVVATALVESASGVSKAAQLEIISFASFNAISKPQRLDNSSCYVRWSNAKGSALRLAVPSWPWKKESKCSEVEHEVRWFHKKKYRIGSFSSFLKTSGHLQVTKLPLQQLGL